MNNSKTLKLSMAGLFAALIFIIAKFISIPLPVGVIQLGDSVIITAGIVLGPVVGGIASAIAGSLFDISTPYAVYAPATFVIKFLMAAAAYLVYKIVASKRDSMVFKCAGYVSSAIIGGAIMIGGYFIYELFLTNYATALSTIVPNMVQAGGSTILGLPIFIAISKALSILKIRLSASNS